ncbi:peptide ABC transporter permease [Mesorhizobium sp. M1378]|uniref:peptide ABC transporter permease n=2 Tax=unclassified Mesorhizobium TaxID=325217 RepID=UPI00333AA301
MSNDRDKDGPVFSAEQARQGEIILRTRARRIIFIAGLAGLVLLALLVWWIEFLTAGAKS